MNVKVSPSDLPNARQSRAEIYSKSICILFKQQFVSALPRLILYSLFDFKFPKGIIININWSFISTSYTWMYRVITKIRRGRSIKAHFSVMISYTALFCPRLLLTLIFILISHCCCNETIYRKYNALCVINIIFSTFLKGLIISHKTLIFNRSFHLLFRAWRNLFMTYGGRKSEKRRGRKKERK